MLEHLVHNPPCVCTEEDQNVHFLSGYIIEKSDGELTMRGQRGLAEVDES